MGEYLFKIADSEQEFEQIHRLNYETFVEEIPQHEPNSKRVLVDKFHKENTYIICLKGHELVGMATVRDRRPFSLDLKLGSVEDYLPQRKGNICEIRLLSIRKEHRNKKVLKGLFNLLARYCEDMGYRMSVISATTNQIKLYRNLGFVSFGPLVGSNGASFQPMYLTMESYENFKDRSQVLRELRGSKEVGYGEKETILLPGPVKVRECVRKEFSRPPISHRSAEFLEDFKKVKERLCSLTHSRYITIMSGSGTVANDVVSAQLALLEGRGLVLSNGEFGERLGDHAKRFDLDFEFVDFGWGKRFDKGIVEDLSKDGSLKWVWFVHSETSTGVVNDLEDMKRVCLDNGIKVCVDCISSIGNIPVDLEGMYLATGVSGKGIGAYPGLSFVFYNHKIQKTSSRLPRYLDLSLFEKTDGVPFTISSNLVFALKAALECTDYTEKYQRLRRISSGIRKTLEDMELEVLGNERNCSPAVITFRVPSHLSSESLGRFLEKEGFYLSYRSRYLVERNLMQISLMGEFSEKRLEVLLSRLQELLC